MNSVKLSVYFEDPFWIALIEKQTQNTLQVARYVFGPEPSDPEVYQWLLATYAHLVFQASIKPSSPSPLALNYKRRMREVKRALSQPPLETRSQRILQQEYEQTKEKRRVCSKLEQQAELKHRFQLRLEKRKAKH